MSIGVLYAGDYKRNEEVSLHGVLPTIRVETDFSFPIDLPSDATWIVRSRRLTLPSYSRLWETVHRFGSELFTQPLAYGVISSLKVPSLALTGQSPPMVVVSSLTNAIELRSQVAKSGLQYPVFVRSEIESAAKYVGIEGCIVTSPDVDQIEAVLTNLRSNVQSFQEIGVKELWPVRLLGKTTMTMEYRAVGYAGSLVEFDHRRAGPLPAPDPYLERFAQQAFARLAEVGADGAHVVDIALKGDDRRPFVVEWKDLSSASLAVSGQVLPRLADAYGSAIHRGR